MFYPLMTAKFRSRPSTALLTLALLVGSLGNPWIESVAAKPRSQRVSSQPPATVNAGNPSSSRSDARMSQQYADRQLEVSADTLIPVTLDQDQPLTVKKGENQALTLRTTSPLRSSNGAIAVPAGSQIVGQFRTIANGTGMQFVAQQLVLRNGQYYPINAQSRELVGFEQRNSQASAADIIKGTLAGAGTATIIAGTTGDRRINALEVLGGAAVGALAGWGLPSAGILGGNTEEVMTVSSRDLTLMLQSPLRIDAEALRDTNRNLPRQTAWNSGRW